jgi:hypothetical protein
MRCQTEYCAMEYTLIPVTDRSDSSEADRSHPLPPQVTSKDIDSSLIMRRTRLGIVNICRRHRANLSRITPYITWLTVFGQAQTRTNQVQFFDAIVLRVGVLHILPGRCLELTMPHISVYPFQTVSHMYRVLMLTSDRQRRFSQGYAPRGGF